MVFYSRLSGSKSAQVSWTPLGILVVLNEFLSFSRVGIIIIYSLEFFTSVLAVGLSLEFEWQQVSSSLQDSSQDSGYSQQCCRLDSLYPSANFQVLQAF